MAKIFEFHAQKDAIVISCDKLIHLNNEITQMLVDEFGAFSGNSWTRFATDIHQIGEIEELAAWLRKAEKETDLSGSAWSRGMLPGALRNADIRFAQIVQEITISTDITCDIVSRWFRDKSLEIGDLGISSEKSGEKYTLLLFLESLTKEYERLKPLIDNFLMSYDYYISVDRREKAAAKEAEIAALKSQLGRAIADKKKLRGVRGVA
jgi:hypothetical protein